MFYFYSSYKGIKFRTLRAAIICVAFDREVSAATSLFKVRDMKEKLNKWFQYEETKCLKNEMSIRNFNMHCLMIIIFRILKENIDDI